MDADSQVIQSLGRVFAVKVSGRDDFSAVSKDNLRGTELHMYIFKHIGTHSNISLDMLL